MSEISIVPLIHMLNSPAPVEVVRNDVGRFLAAHTIPHVSDVVTLSRTELAFLVTRAYIAGAEWPGRKAEIEARIRETAETAAALRCVCGAELRGDTCTGDPSPPRCRCGHKMSHGTCPQCEPVAWLQSTHACVILRYRSERQTGGRYAWAKVVVGLAGEQTSGAGALQGCYLDARGEWSAPIGALVAEVYPWGPLRGGERVRLCRVRKGRDGRGFLEELPQASDVNDTTRGPWSWPDQWPAFRAAVLRELQRGRVA